MPVVHEQLATLKTTLEVKSELLGIEKGHRKFRYSNDSLLK